MNIHVVQKGDTVWKLAKSYGTSEQRIISDNNIINPRNLVIGQALLILVPEIIYTVQRGDTLTSISEKFQIPVINLIQNNPDLLVNEIIRPGQNLSIKFKGEKNRNIDINAYAYPYIRRDVLIRALPYLTYLTIFGYGFTENGDLITIDDQYLIDLAYKYRTAPVMLLSSITENGNFSGERASLLFENTELQNKVIDNVINTMIQKGYVGLDIDFEYIESEDKENYLNFLRNVSDKLHANGFFMNTDLAPKISSEQKGLLYEAHSYSDIGEISDTVLVMTYEWGYTYKRSRYK